MEQLPLKHELIDSISCAKITQDEFGNWNASFKPKLHSLCKDHKSDIIKVLKECILENKFNPNTVEMLVSDILINDAFSGNDSKQALLEIFKTSKDSMTRSLTLDALNQIYDITNILELYKHEDDEQIKQEMKLLLLDSQSSLFTDMLARRKDFENNPNNFENILNSKISTHNIEQQIVI